MTRIIVDTGFTEFIGCDRISIASACGYDDREGLLSGMQNVPGKAPDGLEIACEQASEGCA
ncbi:MAG TPA: hypothetical protein VF534_11380 [Paraburkholderia sp.]